MLHKYKEGNMKEADHASHSLLSVENYYSQIQKEALAIIFTVKIFHRSLMVNYAGPLKGSYFVEVQSFESGLKCIRLQNGRCATQYVFYKKCSPDMVFIILLYVIMELNLLQTRSSSNM